MEGAEVVFIAVRNTLPAKTDRLTWRHVLTVAKEIGDKDGSSHRCCD
ncbi:MAG: hypothetical protein MZV63_38275 [Marinilabiliales bacterium]|nr:hypothetical protein [Marinilabiliales bacterium]